MEWASKTDPSKLIFLDEAGANLSMCRTHGRAKGQARLVYANPYGRGNKFSMISAVNQEKVLAALYGEGSVDGDFFTHFIKNHLAPVLQPGDYLIMDNVSFHKVKAVQMTVENTGAKIVYLPPYSPELSPIELMWSKLKTILRKYAARTAESFQKAIREAFVGIQSQDLKAWFRHCGYLDQIFCKPL